MIPALAAEAKIFTVDDAISRPEAYRREALRKPFRRIDFGHIAFNGIAEASLETGLAKLIRTSFPDLTPTLSVFRKSPSGQKEPNYIHCDAELGTWTAILYLNPDPPSGDGTFFWRNTETGAIRGTAKEAVSAFSKQGSCTIWKRIEAKFNRVLFFEADLFHSRAFYENYGQDDDARLIQVVFGTGKL